MKYFMDMMKNYLIQDKHHKRFVWLFMCKLREYARPGTVKKRTLGMLNRNDSIDCNTASGRAALMNYFGLNFVYCEL